MVGDNQKQRDWLFISVFSVILATALAITLFILIRSQKSYRHSIIHQWEQQLMTTTRISAANIEAYFQKFSENLNVVANDPVVQSRSCRQKSPFFDKDYCPLANLYNIHSNDIDAIILLDSFGKIIVRFPMFRQDKGTKAEKCPHNISAERHLITGQILISDVFQNIKNEEALTISAPVFYKNKFSGVVRWMLTMKRISGKYFDSISIGKNGMMMFVDNHGVIRACRDKSKLGLNIGDLSKKLGKDITNKHSSQYLRETYDFIGRFSKNEEGTGSCYGIISSSYNLAVFKKVRVGNSKWTLVTTIPFNEITSPINKNALKSLLTGSVISFLIIFFSLWFFRLKVKKDKLEAESKYLSEIARGAEQLKQERQRRFTALIDGQEMERGRISRELHDSLGQYLLAVKIKLEELQSIKASIPMEKILEIKELILNTIEETKLISNNLMPVMIEELGIQAALENLCRDLEATGKIRVEYVSHGIPSKLDLKFQTYIYRITQEALSNVIKHAKATEVNVQLLGNSEQITLVVQDDGIGFDVSQLSISKGNGLSNIRERTGILNGSLDIQSGHEGTTLHIRIYLNQKSTVTGLSNESD
jgi:signal transduction histidine kinase